MKKTVLITGASSGFGELTAKLFQQKDWNVIATMRSPEKDQVLNKLSNVIVIRLDVTDQASIDAAIQTGLETFGSIDALVNNAGYGAYGLLEEASDADIDKQFDTNLKGLIKVTQAVLPTMRQQKSGVIVNITSIGGLIGMPTLSLYSASKFAVEGLSESLSYELKPHGIKVKTVAPGAMKTDFGNAMLLSDGNAKPELDARRKQIEKVMMTAMQEPPKPFGLGDPQLVADKIYQCVTQETPRVNRVGKDAKLMFRLKRLLPEKWLFNMLYKTFSDAK